MKQSLASHKKLPAAQALSRIIALQPLQLGYMCVFKQRSVVTICSLAVLSAVFSSEPSEALNPPVKSETERQPSLAKHRITFHGRSKPVSVGAITATSDRRWLVTGAIDSRSTGVYGQYFVARLDARGQLDSSFGKAGLVKHTTLRGRTSFPRALAVDSRGRVVVAGTVIPDREIKPEGEPRSWEYGFVARYKRDGRIDRTFGTSGRRVFRYRNFQRSTVDTMRLRGDSIFVSGRSGLGVGIALLDSRGRFTGFNRRAIGTPTRSNECPGVSSTVATAVSSSENGWILGGSSTFPTTSGCFAERGLLAMAIAESGELKNEFGENGSVVIAAGRSSGVSWNSIDIDHAGRLIFVGQATPLSSTGVGHEMVISRYHANGLPDLEFGQDGSLRVLQVGDVSHYSGGTYARPVEGGDIYVNGYSTKLDRHVLVRITVGGHLDMTFGTGGVWSFTRLLESSAFTFSHDGRHALFAGIDSTNGDDHRDGRMVIARIRGL